MAVTPAKVGLGVLALLSLAACDPRLEITSPPVKAAFTSSMNMDRVARTEEVSVRSFTTVDGKQVEFAGASCQMESDEITASFVTPAKVVVPVFVQNKRFAERGRPAALRIVCNANGQTGVNTFFALDKEIQTATNAGIAGALLTTVFSGVLASTTPWHFPPEMVVVVEGVNVPTAQ